MRSRFPVVPREDVKGVARNSSNLSCASVAASVMWPPTELFLVVVTINPASANKAKERMKRAINVSIRVKPPDFTMAFMDVSRLYVNRLRIVKAKAIPIDFSG
jgi:hypothetical protein